MTIDVTKPSLSQIKQDTPCMLPDGGQLVHGSCVAISRDAGLLIVGASGSGKSSLALSLMALGVCLVADDQTIVCPGLDGSGIDAQAPKPIRGLIEARGVGILRADTLDICKLRAIVDLDRQEEERLPPVRKERLIGVEIPLLHHVAGPQFAPALIQLLKGGRSA